MRVTQGKIIVDDDRNAHIEVKFDGRDARDDVILVQGDGVIHVSYAYVEMLRDALGEATYQATGTRAIHHEKNRLEGQGNEQPDDSR